MGKAIVTNEGQITLPQHICKQLRIEAGDTLLFEVVQDKLHVKIIYKQDIHELFDSLPGTSFYAGEEAEQNAIAEGFSQSCK